ncbi:MAG: hypothetical protein EHM24_00095, partial [Acidobacteria bacterium]
MAGPTVGHIEVTVDADTGKLKAQVTAAGKEAGKGAADQIDSELGKVDGSQLKKKIALIKKQVEEQLKNIDVDLDIEADTADIKAAKAQINKGLSGIEAEVGVDVDETELASARSEIEGGMGDSGNKSGDAFGKGFGRGLSGRMKLILAGIVELGEPLVAIFEGLASVITQVLGSALQALGGSIGALTPLLFGLGAGVAAVLVGSKGMVTAFKAINTEFATALEEGRAFNLQAEDIQKALKDLTPAARDTAVAFSEILPQLHGIQEAVQEALFAGMGDVLRDLATNVIPDVGEALVIAAGQANTFGKDLVAALKTIDFSQLVGGLTPAMASLSDAISTVVQSIGPFLTAATPAATRLAEMLKLSAESLLAMVTAGQQSGAINDFLQDGLSALSTWWDLLKNIGATLFTIFQAGAEGGTGLVQKLSDIVGKFNEWLNTGPGQDALLQFFATGRQLLSDLTPLLEGAVGFFKNLVQPNTLTAIADIATNLGAMLPVLGELFNISGRISVFQLLAQALAQIAEAIQPLLVPLKQIATVIGETLAEALTALQPLLNAVGRLLGQLLRAVAPLVPIIADLFVRAVEFLVDAFTQLEPVLSPVIDMLTKELAKQLPAVVDVFDELFKAMEPLIPLFIQWLNQALLILAPLLPVLVTSGFQLVTVGAQLLTAFAPLLTVFLQLTNDVLVQLTPLLLTITGALAGVSAGIRIAIAAITDLVGIVADALASILAEFGGVLTKVIGIVAGWVQGVIDWFVNLFNRLIGNSIIP